MKSKLYNFLTKIKCKLGMHNDVQWSRERCEDEKLMTGIFAPSTCKNCGRVTQKFKIPPHSDNFK
jgi:hypothetical protein